MATGRSSRMATSIFGAIVLTDDPSRWQNSPQLPAGEC